MKNNKTYTLKHLLNLIGDDGQIENIMSMVEENVIPGSPPEHLPVFDLPVNSKIFSFAQIFNLCLAMEMNKIGIQDYITTKVLELPALHDCVLELQGHPEQNAILVYGCELLSDDKLTHGSRCDYYCAIKLGDDAEKFFRLIAKRAFLSHYVIDLARIAKAILNQ